MPTAANGKKALGSVNPSATLPIACKGPCPAKGVLNISLAPFVNPSKLKSFGLVKDVLPAKNFFDASAPALVAASNCAAVASAAVVPASFKEPANAVVSFAAAPAALKALPNP